MCGIAGIYLRDPDLKVDMDDITSTLLEEIEARGQHATGVVALNSEGVAEWQKASCDATTFNRYRRIIPEDVRVVLGHTRWATQGLPAFMENNHPIRRGPFYIIHNGHVSNDEELFKKAERHRFGEVDSEAIAAHLAWVGDLSKLPEVMQEIDGDAAVGAVDERNCARLALARGRSSPLWIYAGTKVVLFASTESAVIKAHSKHIGTISAKRLFSLKEGVFLQWRDGEEYEFETFEFKKYRYVWTPPATRKWPSTSWDEYEGYEEYGKYRWESSLDRQLTAKVESTVEKEEADITSDIGTRDIDPDEDTIICDNCSAVAFWDEAVHRWVRGENVSFILCQDCADEFDEDEWIDGAIEEWKADADDEDEVDEDGFTFRTVNTDDFDPSEIEDTDDLAFLGGPVPDEEAEITDNYEAANESVIRSLARMLKGS